MNIKRSSAYNLVRLATHFVQLIALHSSFWWNAIPNQWATRGFYSMCLLLSSVIVVLLDYSYDSLFETSMEFLGGPYDHCLLVKFKHAHGSSFSSLNFHVFRLKCVKWKRKSLNHWEMEMQTPMSVKYALNHQLLQYFFPAVIFVVSDSESFLLFHDPSNILVIK